MNLLSSRTNSKALAGVATLGLALLVAGCAGTGTQPTDAKPAATPTAPATPAVPATPAPESIAAPSGDMGTVVFFRESKFVGGMISFKVREGERELGKLSSGTYFTTQVPTGPHAFTVHSEAKDVLNLEVERGETYYVQGSVAMGVLVGRPNLAPSDAATFNAAKGKLKNSAESKKDTE